MTVVGLALTAVKAAQAGNGYSFLSTHGSDANPCTFAAPCRSFAAAMAATNPNGGIMILDVGGYGSLTIDKGINIVNASGGEAGISFTGTGIGVTVTAGVNDAVNLRGLTIDGVGLGTVGIEFNSGKSLTLEDCVIRRVANDGINFDPNGSSSLSIYNSVKNLCHRV